MLIIHICGPSGAGKTTSGEVLENIFGKRITVKDLDELFSEFQHEHDDEFDPLLYQYFIDKFIKKHSDKPLVFVGLNINLTNWRSKRVFDLHSHFEYFINSNDEKILVQKCLRYINGKLCPFKDSELYKLVNDNRKFVARQQRALQFNCDKETMIEMNNHWRKIFSRLKYKFLSQIDILDEVIKILEAYLET